MSNKKKRARLKRRQELLAENSRQNNNRQKGTRFSNSVNGIMFILAGIVCAGAFAAIAVYSEFSAGKVANMILLAFMTVYFFYRGPRYLMSKNKNR